MHTRQGSEHPARSHTPVMAVCSYACGTIYSSRQLLHRATPKFAGLERLGGAEVAPGDRAGWALSREMRAALRLSLLSSTTRIAHA